MRITGSVYLDGKSVEDVQAMLRTIINALNGADLDTHHAEFDLGGDRLWPGLHSCRFRAIDNSRLPTIEEVSGLIDFSEESTTTAVEQSPA